MFRIGDSSYHVTWTGLDIIITRVNNNSTAVTCERKILGTKDNLDTTSSSQERLERISPAIYGSPPDEPLGIHPTIQFRIGFYFHAQCFASLDTSNAMCSSLGRTFLCRARSFL